RDTLGRRDGVEIGVGDRHVPAHDNVIADAQLLFAQQHRIGEVTVIPDLYAPLFADGEMNDLHRGVVANRERGVAFTEEAPEGVFVRDHTACADAHVGGQRHAFQTLTTHIY